MKNLDFSPVEWVRKEKGKETRYSLYSRERCT
jgi:hypothetical protein